MLVLLASSESMMEEKLQRRPGKMKNANVCNRLPILFGDCQEHYHCRKNFQVQYCVFYDVHIMMELPNTTFLGTYPHH